MPEPVYLIAPPGERREALVREMGSVVEPLASLQTLGGLNERVPGLILIVRSGGDDAQLVAVAEAIARAPAGWRLAVTDAGPNSAVRSLAFGPNVSVADACASNRAADRTGAELTSVLSQVSRMRHDLNNYLTSALAEIQLLLMDVTSDDLKESYEVIQEQLREIRRAIAATTHLRP